MELYQDQTDSIAIRVTNHISAMLAYWDKDLVCRFANDAYLEWFGKRHEDMIDKMTIKELLGPLYEKNKPFILDALNGNVQTFEREITLPTGEVRHSLANYYPDKKDGGVVGFFVHVADVTPIKLLEQELKESNITVSEQNKRLLNFANIVSHNLRSYSNNLALVLNLFTAATESKKIEMLGMLKDISKAFSSTIEHLNQIARLQNQEKINFQQVNALEYIKKAIQILQIQIDSTHCTIKNQVEASVILWVNPAYLESILLNFLTNAIKYRHSDREPVIELATHAIDDKIVLSIKDNGRGINLEKHGADLFGMYKTFHGNSDAQGVGLFITKYQIEAMGGRVEVESTENVGSTFSIYFNSQSKDSYKNV